MASAGVIRVAADKERDTVEPSQTLKEGSHGELTVVAHDGHWGAATVGTAQPPVIRGSPFTEEDLERSHARWAVIDQRLADVLLLLGWTGLRWAEARAMVVGDLMQVPTPGLMVRRSAPEGVGTKSTKGRRSRRVPLADRVLPIVLGFAEGKDAGDLLFTTSRGATLHRSAVLRSVKWPSTGHGRRIHDLRHTAACLWLARGVDPGTVQAWMGHESISTTNRYLHFLGTGADAAGLARLNSTPGGTGGARGRETGG